MSANASRVNLGKNFSPPIRFKSFDGSSANFSR